MVKSDRGVNCGCLFLFVSLIFLKIIGVLNLSWWWFIIPIIFLMLLGFLIFTTLIISYTIINISIKNRNSKK